ncbi:hypothetical protein QIA30_06245 (plasmid) [Borreliella turdi]|uniref:hypothetical protein n=1 Tax=Borreliella turdi TaxID=57863 RepID=UPI003AF11081
MGNKIFYILVVVLILMVGYDWDNIKDKSMEISELLGKDKDKTKNQNRIELGENNSSLSKNNMYVVEIDIASLERSRVDLINYPQQVNEPVISNDNKDVDGDIKPEKKKNL